MNFIYIHVLSTAYFPLIPSLSQFSLIIYLQNFASCTKPEIQFETVQLHELQTENSSWIQDIWKFEASFAFVLQQIRIINGPSQMLD